MKLLCDMRYLMANLSGFFMTTRMHIYLFYCCRDKKPAQFSYVFVYFVRCELSFFFPSFISSLQLLQIKLQQLVFAQISDSKTKQCCWL